MNQQAEVSVFVRDIMIRWTLESCINNCSQWHRILPSSYHFSFKRFGNTGSIILFFFNQNLTIRLRT